LPNVRDLGPVDPSTNVEVSVIVRPRAAPPAIAQDGLLPHERQPLSRQAYADSYGASDADLTRVEQFASSFGLRVLERSAARRTVRLSGTAQAMNAAFGVNLRRFEADGLEFRGRVGPIFVPADLADVVQAVLGLDDRPTARAHIRPRPPIPAKPLATAVSYTPPEVAQLYAFPTGVNGQGQAVAIIELGGGYRDAQLAAYFASLGIQPPPTVTSVSVDGATNSPGGEADGEVQLDIEICGAVAPGAHIVVYFAPNTDSGFLDAVTTAVHDTTYQPSVLSVSWGSQEETWTEQSRRTLDEAFQAAVALGVSICVASGDDGSSDGATDGQAHVDFPAASPNVLACGGTALYGTNGTIASESVWNDGKEGGASGGGVSTAFRLPTWQNGAHVPPSANPGGSVGRGVPDVAGNADPSTGYQVSIDGTHTVVGGTSAVAPLWAGLIALLNEQLGHPLGFVNPVLYQRLAGTSALRDVTAGNNGAYHAAAGWDACTGLGSPDGTVMASQLAPRPPGT
jgi:kumamolisin